LPELNSQTKFGFNPNDHPKSRTYKVFTAMPRGRPKGAKSVKTRIAIARAELAAKAPPIDYSMPIDSLDIMERVMRHFYQRAMIEQSIGVQADRKRCIQSAVDAVPDNALYPARRSRRRNRNVATALGARAAS
jgi:hypothetical protein